MSGDCVEIDDLFRKLKPILGSRMDALWLDYQLNPESRKEVEGILRALAARHLGSTFEEKNVLLVPPQVEVGQGEYQLGRILYGPQEYGPFGLRERDWIQHVGIFGRTGSGKTNVGMLVLRNLLEKGKPFVVFDWKRNYRDILAWPESKGIRVYTVGRDIAPFRFNPLIPPAGTSPTVWLKKLIEIMCHVYWLGEGVAYLLQRAIDSVYQTHGAYSGPQRWPTFADVQGWLLQYKAKGREAQWMDSTLRVLGTLCYGEVGKVLNSSSPTALRDLLGQRVILELDALANSDKTFLIETLLLWIHHYRMQEPTREQFKHAIVIEEAHHVLLRRKESRENVMDVIVREIRELGEALIVIDQHPSLISIPSLGNTHCTIAMNLKHARDVNAVAEAMLLAEGEKEYLGQIEVGMGIVKLQSRWVKPFLVSFPLVQVSKGLITDERLSKLAVTYSAKTEAILPVQPTTREIPVIQTAEKVRGEEKNKLKEEEQRMLLDVMQHPTSGVAARYRRLLLGVARGSSLVESLVSASLLRSDFVPTPQGRVRFLQITDRGFEVLRKAGHEVERKRGGGPEHEYWKHRVAEAFAARGFSVTLEKPIGQGRTVDVEARRDGTTIAVEIETGKSDVEANLRKLAIAGYSHIWVVMVGRVPNLKAPVEAKGLNIRVVRPEEVSHALDKFQPRASEKVSVTLDP